MNNDQYSKLLEENERIRADLDKTLVEFGRFRNQLRQILTNNGVDSNPGWTEDDITMAFATLLQAMWRTNES